MGFAAVDYAIVAVYLVGVTLGGVWIAGRQTSSRDYFLGGKDMAWWSVGFSIVASETSTLTFSVPGLAYRGNMHFLQLSFGYFVGRLLVSVLFIPAYFEGDLETAYDFLGRRFGPSLRKAASTVFIVTRVLASGVRLFATAIPVHIITGLSYPASILLIGGFTLAGRRQRRCTRWCGITSRCCTGRSAMLRSRCASPSTPVRSWKPTSIAGCSAAALRA